MRTMECCAWVESLMKKQKCKRLEGTAQSQKPHTHTHTQTLMNSVADYIMLY